MIKPVWKTLTIGERAKLVSDQFISGQGSMLELDLLCHELSQETADAIIDLKAKRMLEPDEHRGDWTPLDELIISYQDILTSLEGMREVIERKALLN